MGYINMFIHSQWVDAFFGESGKFKVNLQRIYEGTEHVLQIHMCYQRKGETKPEHLVFSLLKRKAHFVINALKDFCRTASRNVYSVYTSLRRDAVRKELCENVHYYVLSSLCTYLQSMPNLLTDSGDFIALRILQLIVSVRSHWATPS